MQLDTEQTYFMIAYWERWVGRAGGANEEVEWNNCRHDKRSSHRDSRAFRLLWRWRSHNLPLMSPTVLRGELVYLFFSDKWKSFAHEAVATVTTVSRQNVSASSLLALSQLGAHKHNQPIILPRFRVQTQIFKYSSNTWIYARTAAHIKMLTKFNSLRQSNPVIFSNSLTWCREGIDCHHGEQVWLPHTYTCISVGTAEIWRSIFTFKSRGCQSCRISFDIFFSCFFFF